ncbi:hypothetical protein Y032_0093g2655 [Ancylostoma ceylanicum]|uniref:Uncharacterized protein n=1 Tax=Ancylostoma ceylanicum TaxID=53326 RepID=A0A016TLK9_9BILA|nr:hypothetical protein Y032_0093g2655 [Ancylostoma ceylanicum]
MANAGSAAFNPNDSRYKACCCHTKTFTIVVGILEIFAICFVLVAVLPDVNSRLCEFAVASQNSSGNASDPSHYAVAIVHLRQLMCDLSIVWLIWAIAQIVGINLVFYGIKNIRWRFFVPHLILRFLGTGVLGCLIAILTFSAISEENNTAHIIGLIFVALLVVFWIYSTVTECWCAHFVKRSQETGFSISVARPIGPATISLSEREAPASPPTRQLPPLRHTYGGRRDPQKYAQ